MPFLLVRLTAALPVDLQSLTPGALLRPDDGALLLVLLSALAWVSWASLSLSVVVELAAALRGVPTPRIAGLAAPQRLAGALVASLLVGAISLGSGSSGHAAPTDLVAAVLATQGDPGEESLKGLDGRTGEQPRSAARPGTEPTSAAELPTIVTQRHDTLWLLAEQYLGKGERFTEIVDLNAGVRQPDGRELKDEGRLYPGWELRLPADADPEAARPDRHVVRPGETLWGIAGEELGDPTRYRQLFKRNRGDLQPDGQALREARLIRPGWVIALPSEGDRPAPDSSSARPPAHPRPTDSGHQATDSAAGEDALDHAIDGLDGRAGATADRPTADRSTQDHSTGAQPTDDVPTTAPPTESADGAKRAAGRMLPLDRGDSTPAPSGSASGSGESGSADGGQASPSAGKGSALEEDAHESASAHPSQRPESGNGSQGSGSVRGSSGDDGQDSGPAPSGGQAGPIPPPSQAPTTSPSATKEPSSAPDGAAAGGSGRGPGGAAPAKGESAPVPHVSSSAAGGLDLPDDEPDRLAETTAPSTVPQATPRTDPGGERNDGSQSSPEEAGDPLEAAAEDPSDGMGVSLPAGGFAAALVLAGVAGELARRRRQFQRLRRAGDRLPVPSWRAGRLEATLAGSDASDVAALARAFAVLAESPAIPPVRIVELASDEVVLHLAEGVPGGLVPSPYALVGAGTLRARREDLDTVGQSSASSAPGRALVTVGTRTGRTILVNLETVGSLRIAGDDQMAGDVLRSIATEVALDPRLRGFTRTLCLRGAPIAQAAEVGDVIVDPETDRVRRAVETALRRSGGLPMAAATASGTADYGIAAQGMAASGVVTIKGSAVNEASADSDPEWSDPFEIVVADRSLGVVVPGCSGVGLVTSGEVGAAGITLAMRDPGRATLVEDGIELCPVGMSAATVDDLVELFEATESPADPLQNQPRRSPMVPPHTAGVRAEVGVVTSAAPGALLATKRGPGPDAEREASPELEPTVTSGVTQDATADAQPNGSASTSPDAAAGAGEDATVGRSHEAAAAATPDATPGSGQESAADDVLRARAVVSQDGVADPRPDVTAASALGAHAVARQDATAGARQDGIAEAGHGARAAASLNAVADARLDATAAASQDAVAGARPDATATAAQRAAVGAGPDDQAGTGEEPTVGAATNPAGASVNQPAGTTAVSHSGPQSDSSSAGADAGGGPGIADSVSTPPSIAPADPSREQGPGHTAADSGQPPASVALARAASARSSDSLGEWPRAGSAAATGSDQDPRPRPLAPRLLLLGDLEVENAQGRAEPARLGRLSETAAFVLLHPGSRPSELLAALWPGRSANPQSCRQMISRTRSWLGRTDEGDTYLEAFANTGGRLRLRPEVRSDWDDFLVLADRGLADPDDLDSLTAALELVRGRPFGSLWRRELAWADVSVHNMISRIIDVAYELALRLEAAGRHREARAAIHRALRTQAESELLDDLLERLQEA